AGTQDVRELLADMALESRKGGDQELGAPCAVLLELGQSRPARSSQHVQQNRLRRLCRAAVPADVDFLIETENGMVAAGRIDPPNSQLPEGLPIAQGNAGVHQRRLD